MEQAIRIKFVNISENHPYIKKLFSFSKNKEEFNVEFKDFIKLFI